MSMKSAVMKRKLLVLLAVALLCCIALGIANGLERMGLIEGDRQEFDTFDYL